ncbi:hypothetical protein GZH47_02140 [Paenibacillus rhizovicinus]|uniref:Uncharacterized protein n=1 Tax=Paenibacillus rhizovicinus TaxID=2704463 RepID=A0A6C0NU92_9BACL|nr:hypothetical protein [Paenibacillus rhizovicinus]QHW29755.1 hypothetical protein GZH47_02140 [Paenibacillus rhizovicinus]
MKKKESNSQAIFEARISRMVITGTKKQAIEKAAYELNKSNLPLDWLTLYNEQGESNEFRVCQVELLEWQDAEFTDAYHQFKVHGRMILTISPRQAAFEHGEPEHGVYRLPQSSLYDKPVIVLSEGMNHYFLTVLQQELKWDSPMIKVVNPLSKLA